MSSTLNWSFAMAINLLYHDCETRSILDLEEVGTDNYVKHPTTKALMLSWALNDGKVELWQPHLQPKMPSPLADALHDPSVIKVAWNATFERNVWRYLYNLWIPYDQWRDPMIWARHMSMPGSLEDVGTILGLKATEVKMADEGKRLVQMFSLPVKKGGEKTLFGISEPVFRDWRTDPQDWELFGEYCKQDTKTERIALHKLEKFPLPPIEQQGWQLDQLINDKGMPVDMKGVTGALNIAVAAKEDLLKQIQTLTGLENPNSNDQVLGWVRNHGYCFGSLEKPMVARALNGECPLDDDAKKVLTIRKQASKTSYKKLEAILHAVSSDSYLRDQFAYMGASRAGRWTGHVVQLQNLPRPVKEIDKAMARVLELLQAGDYLSLALEFETPIMDIVASSLRGMFRAPEGWKFVVSDLNAIENRVLGWVAGCDAILKVFRDGKDPYIAFAVFMYKQTYEELYKEWKGGDGTKRQNAKPAVLGAGYRLGCGDEVTDKDGDIIKTGLWGYAEAMGTKLTRDEACEAVKTFRAAYPEVVQLWYDLENAAFAALRTGEPQTVGPVTFQAFGKKLLRIMLPSGRALHYIRPKIEKIAFGDYGEKNTLTYEGINQETKQWTRITTHGGKLTENIVQAISRDILLHGMFLAQDRGFDIRGHVHDEMITLVRQDSPLGVEQLRECMIASPDWASDLPLNAEGYESQFYKKG